MIATGWLPGPLDLEKATADEEHIPNAEARQIERTWRGIHSLRSGDPAGALANPWSPLIEESSQSVLRRRPLRRHDRIPHRVARGVVSSHPVGAENPFKLAANPFERSA